MSARVYGSSPISLAFNAPLCGVDSSDEPTMHAVEMESAVATAINGETAVARCGAEGLRLALVRIPAEPDAGVPMLWPPRVTTLVRATLCPACMKRHERPRDTQPYRCMGIDGA